MLLTACMINPLAAMECTDVAMPDVQQEETFPFMDLPPEMQLHVITHGIYSTLSKEHKSAQRLLVAEAGISVEEVGRAISLTVSEIPNRRQLIDRFIVLHNSLQKVSSACLEHVRTLAMMRQVSRYFFDIFTSSVMSRSLINGNYNPSCLYVCLDKSVSHDNVDIWLHTLLDAIKNLAQQNYLGLLHQAIFANKESYVQILLEKGIDDAEPAVISGMLKTVRLNASVLRVEKWLQDKNI